MSKPPTGDGVGPSAEKADDGELTPVPSTLDPAAATAARGNKGINLYAAMGSIGGLTMVSRVLGFVREVVVARVLGASAAADVFTLAFLIPNLFRRLFGEGESQAPNVTGQA